MSVSLMSCVRQNSPPLELEPADEALPNNAVHDSFANANHELGAHNSSSRITTTTASSSNTAAAVAAATAAAAAASVTDDASQSSQQTNTQKRRRRFQPLRKLRRMFRLDSGPDPDASSVSTASVYKPASERDCRDDYSFGSGGQLSPAQSTADSAASPQRPHCEPRPRQPTAAVPYDAVVSSKGERRVSNQHQLPAMFQHGVGGKPVLHLRHDSRESIYREAAEHQHLQQYLQHGHHHHYQHHHSSHHHQHQHGNHAPHRQASDAVDFQQHSGALAAATAAAKRRSNSECLVGDLKSEPLSQSHDSVFSESVTASSMSIGLKAELASVLAKKYAGRRTGERAPTAGDATSFDKAGVNADDDGADADNDDDDDDEEEDLGLPRSPNTPVRGTRAPPLGSGGGSSSRRTSSSAVASPMRNHGHHHQHHHHHVSSDGSLSMLSMESSELIGDGVGGGNVSGSGMLRLANRYQSETDVDIGLPVTVLNHSAARHKMAVRPKRKQAPSRMLRPPPLPIDEDVVADTVDTSEIPLAAADRSSRSSKSSSLPPGMNAKMLPQHAANRTTKITVNESNARDLYANRSLSKSFDFDATTIGHNESPSESGVHVAEKETSAKETSGFFRRLLTYGSLKKKPSASSSVARAAAVAVAAAADLAPPLNTYVPSNRAVAVGVTVMPSPPELLPKPTIKPEKPRSGPASRQRVLPRELAAVPALAVTSSTTSLVSRHHHSSEKLPPISPTTKKPASLDQGSADFLHAGRKHSTECLHGAAVAPQKMHSIADGPSHAIATKRSSTEIPGRPFELDHAHQSGSGIVTGTAFPLYRSDEQLYPRPKSSGTTNMLPTRFSSTSCIMRPPASHPSTMPPPPTFGAKHTAVAASSSSGSSATASPARRSVEKSKSFRFYADTTADTTASNSMHSSAGHMPSLPDLSCWSSASTHSGGTTAPLDSSPSRSRSSHSPNHRQLINKFEINDNNLVTAMAAKAQPPPPGRSLSTGDAATVTVSSRDLRNTVLVTTAGRKTSIVDTSMTAIEDNIDRIMKFACVTVVKTPIGVSQQQQQQQQVTGDATAAAVDANIRRFSNESVEITDQVVPSLTVPVPAATTPTLIERRQSVTDERLKFERRILCEAAPSGPTAVAVEALSPSPNCSESTADPPPSNANYAAASVVLRKKSVSYNSRPQSTANNGRAQAPAMPLTGAATKGADDQTPELMKVFARRSLKLKDTFYVTEDPVSMTPSCGGGDAVNNSTPDVGAVQPLSIGHSLTEYAIINNNNSAATVSVVVNARTASAAIRSSDPKPTALPADKPALPQTKAVGTATVAAASVATAWLSNCQPPATAAVGPKTSSKLPATMVPARSSAVPALDAPKPTLYNNNMLISNNNSNHSNNNNVHTVIGGVSAQRSAEDKANANVTVAETTLTAAVEDVKLRHSTAAAPRGGSRAIDEFKGILQRKAEWEKRATQQFT